MRMNQYVIYRVKDTEIGKKLKHMPYNELGELVQEVKAENYEQIYFGLLEDNKSHISCERIWKSRLNRERNWRSEM